MNTRTLHLAFDRKFLNGVCRHELVNVDDQTDATFLNGVCRHELVAD